MRAPLHLAIVFCYALSANAITAAPPLPAKLSADGLLKSGADKYQRDDLEGAVADWTKAIAADPKLAEAYYNRSQVRRLKGDIDGALADLQKTSELLPRFMKAYNERVTAHLMKGDHNAALAVCEKALEVDPAYAEAYSCRGIALSMKGDLAEGQSAFTKAIELDPANADFYLNRGQFRRASDPKGALVDISKALELNPKLAEAYYHRASFRSAAGDLEGALADNSKAIELKPKYAAAYYNRSALRQQKGDAAGALADATKAIELDPASAPAYELRGALLGKSGQAAEALADLSKAIELNPRNADSYQNRAFLRAQTGESEGALADYAKFVELEPRAAAASHLFRGLIYASQTKWDKAYGEFDAAAQAAPKHLPFALYRAVAQMRLGQVEKAKVDLRSAIASHPSAAGEWSPKVAAFLLGDLDEPAFLRAAAVGDEEARRNQQCVGWYYAGIVRLLAKQVPEATNCFRQSLATDRKTFPEYRLAQVELGLLEPKG